MTTIQDYDFYLREGTIHGGDFAGFALAWKGLAGLSGLPARPYTRWYPWILDPAYPNDPNFGVWGVLQWRMTVALVDGLVGLGRVPPTDARGAATMRDELLQYRAIGNVDLQDLDGTVYTVRMTFYTEEAAEQHDAAHPNGGMVAYIEFAQVV